MISPLLTDGDLDIIAIGKGYVERLVVFSDGSAQRRVNDYRLLKEDHVRSKIGVAGR
jgi:hypothetical protein